MYKNCTLSELLRIALTAVALTPVFWGFFWIPTIIGGIMR